MNPTRHLPSIRGSVVADRIYRAAILFFALCVPVLLALIFLEVGRAGWPALRQFGFGFVTSSTWDPGAARSSSRSSPLAGYASRSPS